MLFLLAAAAASATEWSIVGIFAGVATCLGAVKLGLESVEIYHDIKDKAKNK